MTDWYDTEDWYAPLNPPEAALCNNGPAENAGEAPQKNNKLRRRWRITGALCLALVFAAGLRMIVRIPLKRESADAGFGNYSFSSDGDSSEEEELPENFSDYFSSYYTQTTTTQADVRIEKYGEILNFSPELHAAEGNELTLSELYERCSASIVGIAAYADDSSGYGWGTGVVLREDGLILTNAHVIDDSDRVEITLPDGSTEEAKLIGADSISDLALLKIEASGLQAAQFGDSSALKPGEHVAAIGNPLGDTFTGTLTDGIISAIGRSVTYNGRSMTLLQTNAALNEGNSGGALFNMYGQVIGITNMKMMSSYSSIEGIGFAIPSATVRDVVEALAADGEVKGRPSIGITVGAIPDEIGAHYDLPQGLYVAGVAEGSDAEKQGIVTGDIVTAVNGTPVTDSQQVVDMKDQLQVGDTMTFTIWRNGTEQDIVIMLMDTNDIYK